MTLKHRIEAFYGANDDEELSIADMLVKFGADPSHTREVVRSMVREGILRKEVRPSDSGGLAGHYVYSLVRATA